MTRNWACAVVMAMVTILAVLPVHAQQRPSYESLWAEATAQADAKIVEYPDFTMVESRNGLALYYFTKPAHFAHPGVIKRSITQKDGAVYIHEEGWSFGDDNAQPAFQRWLDQFNELDRQVTEQIQRDQGKSPPPN